MNGPTSYAMADTRQKSAATLELLQPGIRVDDEFREFSLSLGHNRRSPSPHEFPPWDSFPGAGTQSYTLLVKIGLRQKATFGNVKSSPGAIPAISTNS